MTKLKATRKTFSLKYHKNLSKAKRGFFYKRGMNDETLDNFKIGYDKESKHYTFPYFNESGKCTFIKYINSDKKQFWRPNNSTGIRIFNVSDISKAKKNHATLYISEGEKDCLILKQAGYYCVAISGVNGFKEEYVELFEGVKEVIVCFDNDTPGEEGSQKICNLLRFKAKALIWPKGLKEGYDINDLYLDHQKGFNEYFDKLVKESIKKCKPLLSPIGNRIDEFIASFTTNHFGIPTGFEKLDKSISGLSGIIILAGQPKIGKSMFALNIAINAAKEKFPVVYFDFENGFRTTMRRILSNLKEIPTTELKKTDILTPKFFDPLNSFSKNFIIHRPSLPTKSEKFKIDQNEIEQFTLSKIYHSVREELNLKKQLLIVVDSLQKLPTVNFFDRRSNIDQWLRAFEWAKDECNIVFLIISELKRGTYDKERMDSFKESGDIEYTADLALQMFEEKDGNEEKIIKLHATANRYGESGLIATYAPKYNISKFFELKDLVYTAN